MNVKALYKLYAIILIIFVSFKVKEELAVLECSDLDLSSPPALTKSPTLKVSSLQRLSQLEVQKTKPLQPFSPEQA